MDDATITKLHATLEEGAAARGKSGGLGFAKKDGKAKKQEAGGPSKREFATTTSGAHSRCSTAHSASWHVTVALSCTQVPSPPGTGTLGRGQSSSR